MSSCIQEVAETLIAKKKIVIERNEDEDRSSNVSLLKEDDQRSDRKQEDHDHIKSAKAQMDAIREDNERLKLTLSQILKDYNSLKMHFNSIAPRDDATPQKNTATPQEFLPHLSLSPSKLPMEEESELVSLSLGRFSSVDEKREEKMNNNEKEYGKLDGLELGLECKFDLGFTQLMNNTSQDNSSYESKEEEQKDTLMPSKTLKTTRSGDDDDILLHNPLKKPRVSIRATCDTQTMNDGCQWRKYGQKIAKGNPCPRAYYRCTVSSSCPVRKQVQRCVDDTSILITTYEGTHNHPLSVSAEAVASATSAAAAMLKSGSSTSQPSVGVSVTSSTSTNLHQFLTFNSTNNLTTSRVPFNASRVSISTTQSHPTVVLDLTTPNIFPSYNKSASTLFSSTPSSSACLNFSSTSNNTTLKLPWNTEFFNRSSALFKNHVATSYNSQPYVQNSQEVPNIHVTDKIAAATKAIARDPTFQSALAAAITSIVGTSSSNFQEDNGNFHLYFPQQSTRDGIGCATSYVNKLPQPLMSQQKNLVSFPPLTFSRSKSAAMSLGDEGEK